MPRHIFLIGFMGSGKTHWGRALAEKLGRPFLDLDAFIEEKEGAAIPEIFSQLGEAAFRDLERDCLRDLAELPPSVVATGGGTPCFFDNMDWMNANGTTIYLKTSVSVLFSRLKTGRTKRPLLAALSDPDLLIFIEGLLATRAVFYRQAEVEVECGLNDLDTMGKLLQVCNLSKT